MMKLALVIYALVVVILLGMIWTYNQPQPLAVEEIAIAPAAVQTCRLHTLPSPCDGKCTRQDSRSYT